MTPYFTEAWAYGGIPRIATTLVREQVRRGHRVTVCTTDAGTARARARSSAVPERALPEQALPERALPEQAPPERALPGAGQSDIRTFRNLSNRLAYEAQLFLPWGLGAFLKAHARDFDIAHLHACRNVPVTLAARHLRAAGVPYVLAPNGTAPRIERRRTAKWIYDQVLGSRDLPDASAVIAVSGAEQRQLEAWGVDRDRLRLVPNPVDLDEHASPVPRGGFRARHNLQSARVVLFLGKLTPRKRVDVLIDAFASGLDADARLVIAGNDLGSGAALLRQVRALGLDSRVTFTGLLTGADRLQALTDADVLVYPSADEVFGLVPLDALLVGTPVVVAGDSGCGEIVREIGGGEVVPVGDVAALSQAIRAILQQPDVWRAGARAAAAQVRVRFSGPRVAEQLDAVYDDVLAH